MNTEHASTPREPRYTIWATKDYHHALAVRRERGAAKEKDKYISVFAVVPDVTGEENVFRNKYVPSYVEYDTLSSHFHKIPGTTADELYPELIEYLNTHKLVFGKIGSRYVATINTKKLVPEFDGKIVAIFDTGKGFKIMRKHPSVFANVKWVSYYDVKTNNKEFFNDVINLYGGLA